MNYKSIELPFKADALEPYIDKETVETHYGKHLQGYVNKTNELFKGHEDFTEGKTLEEILTDTSKIPVEIRQGVINQGGGVVNHNFYFSILGPAKGKGPSGKLLEDINKTFGSFEEMKKKVTEVATGLFGSGYAWLILDENNKLKVMPTNNQNAPISKGWKPILTIDVWEHSYYLKHKNLRADYVNDIWNVFNWDKIEEYYNSYIK